MPNVKRLSFALALALAFSAAAEEPLPRKKREKPAAPAPAHRAGAAPQGAARPGPLAPIPPGAPLALRPSRLRPPPGSGAVVSVAAGRAYLDAGAEDGLSVGAPLTLTRAGRPAGACTVEAVTAHSATCAGEGLRVGYGFALPAPAKPSAPPPKPLPPLVAQDETEKRRAMVESAPLAKVEFKAAPEVPFLQGPEEVEARLVHESFLASSASALHEERLEARVYGAEVFPRWRLFLDASAIYRGASADGARFLPGDSALLEVRELELASREPGQALSLAVGRVLPVSAPGSTAFDGAQVGWRGPGREMGVFGGLVPDLSTTGLTTDRSTAGLYGSLERASADLLLHGDGRVAYVHAPEVGTRVEVETALHAWIARRYDVSGEARLGFGDTTAPASLDSARLDLSARLLERLWVTGGVRYVGLFVSDPGAPALFENPARHADFEAAYDLTRYLTLRGTLGYAKDLTSGQSRTYGGPEVALPHLFGGDGGVSAGWLEEGGWAGGRDLWLQLEGTLLGRLRLIGRGSLFVLHQAAPASDLVTAGLFASAAFDLASWLRLGLSGLGRLQASPQPADATLGGLSVLANVTGRY